MITDATEIRYLIAKALGVDSSMIEVEVNTTWVETNIVIRVKG